MPTLKEINKAVDGELVGDENAEVSGIAAIEDAREGDLTFIANKKNLTLLQASRASAVIVRQGTDIGRKGINVLFVKDPHLALAKAIEALRPVERPLAGIHPSASVHKAAHIANGVSIGACAVIEEGASLGDGVIVHPLVFVGRGAKVGAGSIMHPGVVVMDGSVIGARCIIHPNSVIGSDGFGYAKVGAGYYKIPQRGIVRIEDDVEIGACVTIDRATLGETVVGRGTKIDNLVQIAHNVKVGEDTVVVAQTGIAGSAKVGSSVQLGGQSGVAGHIEVGDNSTIAAKAGVTNSIGKGSVVSGMPAIPHANWLRSSAVFADLPDMKKRLIELEKRIKELEGD
jgi:UDP-3-O-[3-hydroxymyristoyl] glucosamine N-acyltransferase